MCSNLASATVVLHIVQKTEGFFAKDFGKLLLLFYHLLIKDSAELVQHVLCITIESRDILRGIFSHFDRTRCNSSARRAVCITFRRHGEACGVIDLVLLLSAHLVIAAVVVIFGAYALCAVVRTVLQTAERERPCREAVLLLIRFACNDRALEVGVLLDVDVEATFSSEDTRLASGASIVGVDRSSVR